MAAITRIEWTDSTWNPVTGCAKVSKGCDNCYAERHSERFRGTPGNYFESGFDLTLRPGKLDQPLKWKQPRKIFVNSMSDLFHKDIPSRYIDQVFDVMETVDRHVYQVLTKRSSLMRDYVNDRYRHQAPGHIWLGVSIEDGDALARLRHLRQTRATSRFLSLEPLLGPLDDLDLSGIGWVIVGGESGPGHRPMDLAWVRSIRDQCRDTDVPFFLKQVIGSGGRKVPVELWPGDLVMRQTPAPMAKS